MLFVIQIVLHILATFLTLLKTGVLQESLKENVFLAHALFYAIFRRDVNYD